MDTTMQTELRELLDRDAIWRTLMRYSRGLDRLDIDLVRSVYFDDAIDDHGLFVGFPDDFIAWANGVTSQFVSTQHALLNHTCELADDDAFTETYFLFTGVAEQQPHLMSTGRYIDHFQRRSGEWRIANRVTIIESHFELNDSALARTLPPAYGPGETCPASRDRDDISYHRPPRPRKPDSRRS